MQIYFGTLPTQMPLVEGKLKIVGVTSPARLPTAPDIPTLDEQGLTGLNFTSWNALYAPAGTPRPSSSGWRPSWRRPWPTRRSGAASGHRIDPCARHARIVGPG